MVMQERNQMIYQIHLDHPDWTLQMIADLVGVSRQRVQQIISQYENYAIIPAMTDSISNYPRITEPISLTQVSKLTGIPTSSISDWVSRGLVKILKRPDRKACTGQPVLLDPISLQERIDRYRPRHKKAISA